MLRADDRRHTGGKEDGLLPEVHMMPLSVLEIVDWTCHGAVRASDLLHRLEFDLDIQAGGVLGDLEVGNLTLVV